MKKQSSLKSHSKLKRITLFDVVNTSLVVLLTLLIIYPLYFCVIASFSDPTQVAAGRTLVWIRDFTTDAYRNILKESKLWMGYRNTIIYTVLGTMYNLVLTIPAAYVLTKKYLPFRGIISWFFFLTMFIGGGLVPSYLLMSSLHLVNSPLSMILGTGVSCYNLIVTRQYFSTSIHPDIYDAAYIDGAGEWQCLSRIALPLAKPILAVMTLYYGVGHWNDYYTALIYLHKEKYYPLQLVLRNILITNQTMILDGTSGKDVATMEYLLNKAHAAQGMKYSIIFIASLPLLVAYPFVQKYFAQGVMIGSVKG